MSPLYPYSSELPTLAYVAPIGIAAVAGLTYWLFKKDNRVAVFAIAFFTFNVMFVLQIVGAGQGYLADRFTYIPYFGLFFLTAYYFDFLLKNYPAKKQVFFGLTGLYLVLFCLFVFLAKIKFGKKTAKPFGHMLPNAIQKTHTPYQNLGKYYQEQGKPELAMTNFNRSIETAKDKDIPYNSRGKLFFDKQEIGKAFADLMLP